jgi:hypothetical protein
MHGMVAEGIFTTTAAVGLARARGVEMPITGQMDAILHEGKAPREAIHELMTRSGKSEALNSKRLPKSAGPAARAFSLPNPRRTPVFIGTFVMAKLAVFPCQHSCPVRIL